MPKKVLIFLPKFPEVSETFIQREVEKLLEFGSLDIKVVSAREGVGVVSPKVSEVLVVKKLTPLDIAKSWLLWLTKTRTVTKAFVEVGVKRPYSFARGLAYAKFFQKYQPEIIYTHFLSEFSNLGLVASIVLECEFAIAGHARDIFEYPDLIKTKAKKAKFISICNKNACTFVQNESGLDNPENIKLIYHGLDPENVRVGVNHKLSKPTELVILSIARLVEKKGLGFLINASRLLSEKGVRHKVYIIGDGPLEGELKQLAEGSSVEFLGKMHFDETKKYIDIADIFVLPNINTESGDVDGVPNTLVEAALAGVPVVTTDAGSNLDFVGEDSAFLVQQKNTQQIADSIEYIINRPDEAQKRAHVLKERAKQMFDTDVNITKIAELLLQG